jgi:hypothetical protein
MPTIEKQYGAVAILDALGASNYSESEIERFLHSRERVLTELSEWVEDAHGSVKIEPSELVTFTFNDTIVMVLRCGTQPIGFLKVTSFAALLRKFLVDSLVGGLLFRGAASLGTFYVDEDTNTVMGDAVTDAAQWYERSDWMGIHFTPRSFIELDRMFSKNKDAKEWAFVRCQVPVRGQEALDTYAINLPKIFLVKGLRPWNDNMDPRVKLLGFLARHRVPMGTEQKYFNTIKFFDHSLEVERRRPKER